MSNQQKKDDRYFVYIVECADKTLYTGYTKDVDRRVKQHNSGIASKYTRTRRPVKLVYWEEVDTISEGLQKEYAIKQLSREEKLQLINMAQEINTCTFCGMMTTTRGHHVIPKSKGGETIVPTCETCESYIHKTWSHNELRDVYNSVEAILANEGFQKFLKWRRKQSPDTLFKSNPGKHRDKRKYS